jgi:ArsR family transcriptional regulator
MNVQTSKRRPAGDGGAALAALLDARLFRALSDPTRLQILLRLTQCSGPCSVTDAARCCRVDFSVVSRHLAMLHDAGILDAQKRGRSVWYTVRYGALSRALRALAGAIDACCPERISRGRADSCCSPPARDEKGEPTT